MVTECYQNTDKKKHFTGNSMDTKRRMGKYIITAKH